MAGWDVTKIYRYPIVGAPGRAEPYDADMRILTGALVGVALVTVLTSCDPVYSRDPIAIQRDGPSLVVAVCEPIIATDILLEQRGPDTSRKWVSFYEAHGSIDVRTGDIFSTAEHAPAPAGMVIRTDPHFTAGTEYAFLFADNNKPYRSASNTFEIGDDGVPHDSWLQWDGTLTESPCGYERRR